YLFREDWLNAEIFSSKVIDRTGLYGLEINPDNVFRAISKEAIWQIAPDGVNNFTPREANQFVLLVNNTGTTITGNTALSSDLINSLGVEDKRNTWIGEINSESEQVYFAEKYWFEHNAEVQQYSMALRLSELYLIRAEARAMQNKLDKAIADLDHIRSRASIDLIADLKPSIGQHSLIDSIMVERKREFFAE